MKLIKKIIIGFIIVLILGLGYAGNYFYEYALKREPEKEEFIPQRTKLNQEWFNQNSNEVHLTSLRNLKLTGYEFIQPENKKWVIVVHGHKTRALKMANYVREFYNLGYNVLAIDLIGHGKSEGNYYTMGGHDSKDLVKWSEYLSNKYQNPDITLFGISMGGATVLNSLDENLPSNVKNFIEDSGYIKVSDEFGYQLKEQFGLPYFPFIPIASLVTKIRSDYFLEEVDATKAIQNTKLPGLIIHGDKDDYVPLEYSKQVYEMLQSNKVLKIFPDAKHCKSEELHTKQYWEEIKTFLSQN